MRRWARAGTNNSQKRKLLLSVNIFHSTICNKHDKSPCELGQGTTRADTGDIWMAACLWDRFLERLRVQILCSHNTLKLFLLKLWDWGAWHSLRAEVSGEFAGSVLSIQLYVGAGSWAQVSRLSDQQPLPAENLPYHSKTPDLKYL